MTAAVRNALWLTPIPALLASGLLSHEYVHSWNGKYRRPADLTTPDYEKPMQDDLLWVYEGLTSYLGDDAERSQRYPHAGSVSRQSGIDRGSAGSRSRPHLAQSAGYGGRSALHAGCARRSGSRGGARLITTTKMF